MYKIHTDMYNKIHCFKLHVFFSFLILLTLLKIMSIYPSADSAQSYSNLYTFDLKAKKVTYCWSFLVWNISGIWY